MLQPEHGRNEYGKPILARDRSRVAREVVPGALLVHQPTATEPRDLGDAAEMTLDEFVALYGDTRDELAYRRLTGDPLSVRETVTLEVMNQIFDRLLPAPQALPSNVTKLVDEILRRG